MPIYEFRCRACRKKTTALVLARHKAADVRCQHCGGADLERLWSRFATVKSDDARLDSLADDSGFADVDENDPRSVMRAVKRLGQEMGEEFGEVEEAMEQELAGGGSEPDTETGDTPMAPGEHGDD